MFGERRSGFEEYARAASPRLLRTAWYLTGDTGRAEDLVQEALTRLYVAWPRVARDDRPVDGYVHRILVHLVIDEQRKRRHEVVVEQAGEAAYDDRHDAATTASDHVDVVRALATLSPRQRQVVVLRHLADLPEREVAEVLGISTGTVKSAGADGLARMRTAMGGSHVRP